ELQAVDGGAQLKHVADELGPPHVPESDHAFAESRSHQQAAVRREGHTPDRVAALTLRRLSGGRHLTSPGVYKLDRFLAGRRDEVPPRVKGYLHRAAADGRGVQGPVLRGGRVKNLQRARELLRGQQRAVSTVGDAADALRLELE